VNVNFWLIQAFNGISYGALLFLVGSGLSLIFGVMRIVNLSHGSYFLLGGYVALTVIWTTGSWVLAIPVAALAIGGVGVVMERAFLRPRPFDPLRQMLLTVGFAFLLQQAALDIGGIHLPVRLRQSVHVGGLDLPLYRIAMVAIALAIGLAFWLAMEKTRIGAWARATVGNGEVARGVASDPLRQVLLTVGFAFLFQQAALDIWTGNNFDVKRPDLLDQSVQVGTLHLEAYRIFMIAMAAVIGLVLWLAMEKTRMGAMVRATVDDAEMARGVGIDTSRISKFIFALGAALAALGGVIGGAFLGIYPGLDFEMLPLAFAVVIIGGMGSLGGAAIGALLVGLADNFGKALFPEVSYFTLYAPMALILAVKPTGLFGRE